MAQLKRLDPPHPTELKGLVTAAMVDDSPGMTLHDNGIQEGTELFLYAVQPGAGN